MKALILTNTGVQPGEVPQPVTAEPGHLIIKMNSSAINPGDKAFINRPLPPGSVKSLYNVYGVSGAGIITQTGEGVPDSYIGKKVSMYRSLHPSQTLVGTWAPFTHIHYLDCVILPNDADLPEYSGSLVNIITPYAFLKQIEVAGHKGIISTAGTSATGIAMVGICEAKNFPLVSIVRNQTAKQQLEQLGAKHVVVQDDVDFAQQLKDIAASLSATAIYDGAGGGVLNKIIELIPNGSTIYSYGYLDDDTPLTVNMRTLTAKGITITPFGNFRTETVQNPQKLALALQDLASMMHLPHFKTKIGQLFKLEQVYEALQYSPQGSGKAVLYHDETE